MIVARTLGGALLATLAASRWPQASAQTRMCDAREPLGGADRFLLSTSQRAELARHRLRPIVFVKTHKTGSGSIMNLLQRMGDWRNLSFLIPSNGSRLVRTWPERFYHTAAPAAQHDISCNHAVYDRARMAAYMRAGGAPVYWLTILRDPHTQVASALKFFKAQVAAYGCNTSLALAHAAAMRGVLHAPLGVLHAPLSDRVLSEYVRSPQAFDLGWYLLHNSSTAHDAQRARVDAWVRALESQFSRVLILERWYESLALMHADLAPAVGLEELVSLPKHQQQGVGKCPPGSAPAWPVTSAADEALLARSHAVDLALYAHFLRVHERAWVAASPAVRRRADELAALDREWRATCEQETDALEWSRPRLELSRPLRRCPPALHLPGMAYTRFLLMRSKRSRELEAGIASTSLRAPAHTVDPGLSLCRRADTSSS